MRFITRTEIMVAAVVAASSVLITSVAIGSRYDTVEELIMRGELLDAEVSLNDVLRDDFIDAEGFYYHSRLEARGDVAVVDLQKGLSLCGDNCSDIVVELVAAYYAQKRYQDAVGIYKSHRKKVEIAPASLKFFWLAGMSYMRLGEYKSAENVFKDIEKKFEDVHLSGWGSLGCGSVEARKGEFGNADSDFRSLISSGGEVSALSIYNRSYLAAQAGDQESGLFGYNLLDERFGRFIGSDELAGLITAKKPNDQSGQSTLSPDTTYTIEMGVFSDKSEADKLVGQLKASKWSVDLESSFSGDNRYWTVRVGIFRSQQAAAKTKDKLESLFPGSYRVVMR
ncbi:MAG: SPOR domain-containing protein [Candidatus Zixiibacteriota bacterium]